MSVEIDPSYLQEAKKKVLESKSDKLDGGVSPDRSREVSADLGQKLVAAWKAADELASEAALAASILEEEDEQFAVADAKHDTAAKIKGVFARAAGEKTPMAQYGKVLQELGALKTRFASEDGEAAAARQETLAGFMEKLKALISG